MTRRYSRSLFRKVLVPVVEGAPAATALTVARMISDEARIVLTGIVAIPGDQTLSAAALPARRLRAILRELEELTRLTAIGRARVSHRPWIEVRQVVAEESPDLLVVSEDQLGQLQVTAGEALSNPPCDIILARGPFPEQPRSVMFALRGGPSAELALRLGLAIGDTTSARLTALHVAAADADARIEAAYKGVERVLRNLPDVLRKSVATDDAAQGILDAAAESDVLVLGATARPVDSAISIGPVADAVLRRRPGGVLVVKSSRPMPPDMGSEIAGRTAISVLVDKWFGENTYHSDEFEDCQSLLQAKTRQKLSVSIALPALNEEQTVGAVIATIKAEFMTLVPLVDEVVLIDSDSNGPNARSGTRIGYPCSRAPTRAG